ncbi:immune inhibitor A domain-containing protein [Microbacterium stercoris]|uniref:Immune inhibitor A n=1 Tax=Microbacterium stercoris TaxID=2820289 RepID=A0A939QH30_9MICO|nr:immune inhibitor A domain-containing protein [Microbacterium stercoris]MBO3662824.1 immune inhibitor A [Microbacterium stercoris]
MKRRITCALGTAAILLTGSLLAPTAATAAPAGIPAAPEPTTQGPADDRPDPLHEKRSAAKQRAAEMVALGEATVKTKGKGKHKSNVVEIRPGEFVEYGTSETAQLFTILVEFADQAHNQIPEPAADDNSTYWVPDFSQAHFQDMFFGEGESFKGVYDEMSSGRFDLEGAVSDWVTAPGTAASYGSNYIDPATGEDQGETNASMTAFIQDTANAWYDAQVAAGKTKDQIVAELNSYDIWDRYDIDGDGVINEPDGYIDHFQAVHAGPGEEAGAPAEAIWSHRWAANPGGRVGPSTHPQVGGVQIGDTDVWIRDYTTEPENGGLGVFAHEFGHDLGLPDYYDTRPGGDNGTGFWTLMSSGSWLSRGDGAIGTLPNQMGPTEKLYLGWLDYEVVQRGTSASVKLGPAYHASTLGAQAVIVDLPEGSYQAELEASPEGSRHLYSGKGNDIRSTATSPAFTVPAGATFAASAKYDIETDWDYAFVEITTDGGATWTALPTNRSTTTDPNGQNTPTNGITGTTSGWVPLTADLSTYAGATAQVRVRYWTDVAEVKAGFQIDGIQISGLPTTDGADDWTLDGFQRVVDGAYTQTYSHYYVAENRVYGGYDQTLRTGPYNFGWQETAVDKVEHFPYQDGLLVWYANSLYQDNNTLQHPGGGEALPVDARAKALKWSDGTVARNRIQPFDATFGQHKTDAISLHRETPTGMTTLKVPSQKAITTFDDSNPDAYYDPENPLGSVRVAGTGTTIKVVDQNVKRGFMTVEVNAAG